MPVRTVTAYKVRTKYTYARKLLRLLGAIQPFPSGICNFRPDIPSLDVARPRQAIGQAERREESSGRRPQGGRWEEDAHRQGSPDRLQTRGEHHQIQIYQ
eukprot:8840329-Pyramimonas_sp.AAC.1